MAWIDIYKQRRERAIEWLGSNYLLFAPINRRYQETLKAAAQKVDKQ